MEWSKDQYNKQYEKWVPWLEDIYLRYFTKDNKASYTAKGLSMFPTARQIRVSNGANTGNLDKTKVTGIEQVDTAQDGVNNFVAGQLGQGGIAEPVGGMTSSQGINRLERQGKDDRGGYIPEAAGPVAQGGNAVIGGAAAGGKKAAGVAQSGLESAGGVLGFGGSKGGK